MNAPKDGGTPSESLFPAGKPPLVAGWTQDEWDETWEAAEHDPALMPTNPPTGDVVPQ